MTMLKKATRATLPVGLVRRAYLVDLEVRGGVSDGAATIEGYASVTETPYEMFDMFGQYTEIVSRGAFGKSLAEKPKVQLLANHEGLSLAATTADSLRLSEDDTGLHMSADLNLSRSDASDLVHAIRDGAVDEMSFAFRVVRQQWSPDYDERRINEVNINRGDVSVVNLGANPDTSVSARSAGVAELSRVVSMLREGRALDPQDVNMLTQSLGWFSAVDSIVDQAQEALAEYLGVPDPDPDERAALTHTLRAADEDFLAARTGA